MVADGFDYPHGVEGNTFGVTWVDDKDAMKHLTIHRSASPPPQQRVTQFECQ
jgi:hypothetical protein